MAITLTHATVAVGTDAGNGEIAKAQWNEAHAISGTLPVANGGTDAATARAAARNLGVPYIFAQSGAAVSAGAVTTEEVLATITIPGGAMGPNGWVQAAVSYNVTSSTNAKFFRVRVGGAAGLLFMDTGIALTTQVSFSRQVIVINANSESSQKSFSQRNNAVGFSLGTAVVNTASVDTTADWELVITGQKASAGEDLTLNSYQVLICYGA